MLAYISLKWNLNIDFWLAIYFIYKILVKTLVTSFFRFSLVLTINPVHCLHELKRIYFERGGNKEKRQTIEFLMFIRNPICTTNISFPFLYRRNTFTYFSTINMPQTKRPHKIYGQEIDQPMLVPLVHTHTHIVEGGRCTQHTGLVSVNNCTLQYSSIFSPKTTHLWVKN